MKRSKTNILNNIKTEACLNIFKDTEINTVILFGSILREDFAEYSDVDIAILSEKDIPFAKMACIEEALQKKLNRNVDIINLIDKNIELNIKVDIYDNGEIIYNNDNFNSYNMNYTDVERLFKDNETFRFFRERDVIFSE